MAPRRWSTVVAPWVPPVGLHRVDRERCKGAVRAVEVEQRLAFSFTNRLDQTDEQRVVTTFDRRAARAIEEGQTIADDRCACGPSVGRDSGQLVDRGWPLGRGKKARQGFLFSRQDIHGEVAA